VAGAPDERGAECRDAADVSLTWQVVGVGDADGDGTVDLFWRDMQTGDVAVWLNGGTVP